VIVDKRGEKSHKDRRKVTKLEKSQRDKKLSYKGGERHSKGERMMLERDQLKLSTKVGGACS
jgi:hypothetical protein